MPSRPGSRRAAPDPVDLRVLPGTFCICRLPADAPYPAMPERAALVSVTRTPRELSVVCPAEATPVGAIVEPGWGAIEVCGPLDFGLLGILAGLTAVLAAAQVSVFVLSTYDTDVILVREGSMSDAIEALRSAGHRIVPE